MAIAGYLLGTLTGNTLFGWILAAVAGAAMYAWSRRAAARGATCGLPGASQRHCRPEPVANDARHIVALGDRAAPKSSVPAGTRPRR
ncbi:MAG: hypothetical protein M0004_11625 [Actinomycetota bacterium]|nr:hypothetical protein [Actinomycetota bacterium]